MQQTDHLTQTEATDGRAKRAWLASLLLSRPHGFATRLAAGLARLRARPRRWRRQFQRRAALSAAAAALILAMSGSAYFTPAAHAAAITVDDPTGAYSLNGLCSLNEAIINANNDIRLFANDGECEGGDGADIISLLVDVELTAAYAYLYDSKSGLAPVTSEIVIAGNGLDIYRDLNNIDRFRILNVGPSGNLTLDDVTISGGIAVNDGDTVLHEGGGIYVYYGELTLLSTTITNSGGRDGAGLFNNGGNISIYDSSFEYNEALGDGGGLFNKGGNISIYDSSFEYNDARGDGGGLYNYQGEVNISNSSFTDNEGDYGGGIFNSDKLTMAGGVVGNNYGYEDGGGILNEGDLTLTGVTVEYNTSTAQGGGVYSGGKLTITGGEFANNNTVGRGGAVFIGSNSTNPLISGVTIHDNDAEIAGGGVFIAFTQATISGSVLYDNEAARGGGIEVAGPGQTTIVNTTLSGNIVTDRGGGISSRYDAQVTVVNSTVTGNEADYGGGLVQDNDGQIIIDRSVISGNIATTQAMEILSSNNGAIVSAGFNVLGHTGYTYVESFTGFTPDASDLVNFTALGDILDENLDNHGGPTATHDLVTGSPAIDLAPSAACLPAPTSKVDQRDYARNFDVAGTGSDTTHLCDAGAYEYGSSPAAAVFMSAKAGGATGDGQAFDNSDILMWDGAGWSMWFDGSAALLAPNNKPKHNVNAFWIPDTAAEDVVMSFAQNRRKVPNISAPVDGTDLVWWDGAAFSLWFDGSDVGLTVKTKEKIDGLHGQPGAAAPDVFGGVCQYYLLISTQGPGKVPAFGGGVLKFGGEDVLGFCATNLGEATTGHWHMALDGSAVGIKKNATDNISLSPDGATLYLTMKKAVNSPLVTGHSMVIAYDPTTQTFTGPIFSAPQNGLNQKVDGLQMD